MGRFLLATLDDPISSSCPSFLRLEIGSSLEDRQSRLVEIGSASGSTNIEGVVASWTLSLTDLMMRGGKTQNISKIITKNIFSNGPDHATGVLLETESEETAKEAHFQKMIDEKAHRSSIRIACALMGSIWNLSLTLGISLPLLCSMLSPNSLNRVRLLGMTHLCFIPKKECPERVQDFRPISLCNVTYRILAKLLSDRMAPLLKSLIYREQSAFIAGRSINDNILLVQEIAHSMSAYKRNKSIILIKFDIEKAFFKGKWEAILRVLQLINFSSSLD